MKSTNIFSLIASVLIFALVVCAAVCASAQAEKNPPKKLADITLFGYHLFQTWDEVKAGFAEDAAKDPYSAEPVSYSLGGTWEAGGASWPCQVELRLRNGIVVGIFLDVQGSGDYAEMEAIFKSLVKAFTDQGIKGKNYNDVIDSIPLWNWSFDAEAGNVWWKVGESVEHAGIEYAAGDARLPITGALGLEFGTPIGKAEKSLPFLNASGIKGDHGSTFKGEKTVTFKVPKSSLPEVFGDGAASGDTFTFTVHFLEDKLASVEVTFGFDEKAYAALKELLAAQYGPPFIDSLSEYRERRWKDMFSHNEIMMQMPDELDAWVEWTTEDYWIADAESLMGEG